MSPDAVPDVTPVYNASFVQSDDLGRC